MAQLPTPNISGAFTSASGVSGSVTWATKSNLNDLDQVRVRYARIAASVSSSPPNASTVRGLSESSSSSWTNFTSSGRAYQYRDDRITSGFDTTPPSYTDRSVGFSEGSLTGYNVWAMARLEV